MAGATEIVMQRGTGYADRIRKYKIAVDGVIKGEIAAGNECTISLEPGRHQLALRVDWCGSPALDFSLGSGQRAVFECGSNLSGWWRWFPLWVVIFRRHEYLWLERIDRG